MTRLSMVMCVLPIGLAWGCMDTDGPGSSQVDAGAVDGATVPMDAQAEARTADAQVQFEGGLLASCGVLQGSCSDPDDGPGGSRVCFALHDYPPATLAAAKQNCSSFRSDGCPTDGAVLVCLMPAADPATCTVFSYYEPTDPARARDACEKARGTVIGPS